MVPCASLLTPHEPQVMSWVLCMAYQPSCIADIVQSRVSPKVGESMINELLSIEAIQTAHRDVLHCLFVWDVTPLPVKEPGC
jgi:hypothetical protein